MHSLLLHRNIPFAQFLCDKESGQARLRSLMIRNFVPCTYEIGALL
jgi:hypothetical protein